MDKDLLLIDLCPRVPYGIKCQVDDGAAGFNDGTLIEIDISKECVRFEADYWWVADIDEIKPYLRTMSSMTEEEKREYNLFFFGAEPLTCDFSVYAVEHRTLYEFDAKNLIDWLNKHYFDYRGLIKKGLALEAKEGMYKIE